jgi:hypothetical protein
MPRIFSGFADLIGNHFSAADEFVCIANPFLSLRPRTDGLAIADRFAPTTNLFARLRPHRPRAGSRHRAFTEQAWPRWGRCVVFRRGNADDLRRCRGRVSSAAQTTRRPFHIGSRRHAAAFGVASRRPTRPGGFRCFVVRKEGRNRPWIKGSSDSRQAFAPAPAPASTISLVKCSRNVARARCSLDLVAASSSRNCAEISCRLIPSMSRMSSISR